MSSPRHSPPPSAATIRPKGILKNASDSAGTVPQVKGVEGGNSMEVDENGNRLAWDESNLTLHEIERETQAARMKIDEPKTPFVRTASLGPMDEDASFDLDSQGGPSYFPEGSSAAGASASSSSTTSRPVNAASTVVSPSGRRSSAAEELAANTIANAGRRPSNAGSATNSGVGGLSQPPAAVGLDSVEMATGGGSAGTNTRRSDSRSPSFTLPNSRRSSAAGERSREGVREEMRNRDDAMQGLEHDEQAFGEEDGEPLDPETKAKQAAFAQKRNAHYGNEAEAMRVAAALAAQDDDEDDEDDEPVTMARSSIPPIPSLPNGKPM